MAKVLARDVHIALSVSESLVLKAGTSVPKEYAGFVTNPRAFVEVEAAPTPVAASTTAQPPVAAPAVVDYAKMQKKPIVELATSRGVDASGSIKEIAARLTAKDAEEATSKEAANSAPDLDSMDEAALRAFAAEHEINVEDASSTEELIALIENAQGV